MVPAILSISLWVAAVVGTPLLSAVSGQPKVPVDSAVYDELVYYAPFSSAASTSSCPNPPHGSVAERYFDINITDTQGGLFRSDARREFILSFPGTDGLPDTITDLVFVPAPYIASGVECLGCLVHLGFLNAWNSASRGIEEALTDSLAEYPDYTLTITGHSLGGAIGDLAFGSLASRGSFRVKQAYVYGAPRVGNILFADYLDKLSGAHDDTPGTHYRVTHANDLIPQIPPTTLGFVHPRTEYWEANDESGNPSEKTTFRCFGHEPTDCNASQKPGSLDSHSSYAGLRYECS